ncbi:MAG: hypothetical protein H0V33_09895 [Acidimicrobiia bacterium]|nr:hypothetical protein [Acidimicrobiia bacterium]
MEGVAGVEELFEREFAPLVRALGVAFADPEAAADAVAPPPTRRRGSA